MNERSIHDNNIYGYSVLCEQRRLILYTEFKDASTEEYTDVTFDRVVAHHFQDVLSGNILFEVEEIEVERIVREWSNLFVERKKYGWPDGIKYRHPDELLEILRQRQVKAFEIASSYGLHGWVLAGSKEIRVPACKAEFRGERD